MNPDSSSQAEELLFRLGQRLKTEREARGLTIQEISSQTRINSTFIAKIEAGELEGLPGLTFVRGFVRSYMKIMELEDEDLELEVGRFASLEQYKAETTLAPNITRMHEESEGFSLPYQKFVIGGIAILLLGWGGYMLYRVLSNPAEAPSAQVDATEKADAPERLADAEKTAGPEGRADPETKPESNPAPGELQPTPPAAGRPRNDAGAAPSPEKRPLEAPQNLRLTIRGLEPTWLRLSIDRAPPIEVLVAPAETLNWDANEEFRLIIGKSHGVAVYLNGEDILLPSERDRLIPNIVLNKLTLLRLEN